VRDPGQDYTLPRTSPRNSKEEYLTFNQGVVMSEFTEGTMAEELDGCRFPVL
jgi:hypothetical protein